jgi:hypothetical protein
MSDFPQGSDWWKARNGLWYPPPATENGDPPEGTGLPDLTSEGAAARAASKRASDRRMGCGGLLILAVIVSLVSWLIGALGDDDTSSADNLDHGAFDVCTQFVKDRLRAPATAEFRNFFQNDGEVMVTHTAGTYTVRSTVDSENGFGASIRSDFTCKVRHVSGTQWRLVDLSIT